MKNVLQKIVTLIIVPLTIGLIPPTLAANVAVNQASYDCTDCAGPSTEFVLDCIKKTFTIIKKIAKPDKTSTTSRKIADLKDLAREYPMKAFVKLKREISNFIIHQTEPEDLIKIKDEWKALKKLFNQF